MTALVLGDGLVKRSFFVAVGRATLLGAILAGPTPASAGITSYWSPGDGSWSGADNRWSSGIPNGIGDVAVFPDAGTTRSYVYLDASVTVGELRLLSSPDEQYLVGSPASSSTLTFQATSGPALIDIQNVYGDWNLGIYSDVGLASDLEIRSGASNMYSWMSGDVDNSAGYTITKKGAATFSMSGTPSHGAGAGLVVEQGTLKVSENMGAGGPTLEVQVAGGTLQTNSQQDLASLAIDSGAFTYAQRLNSTAPVQLNGGTFVANGTVQADVLNPGGLFSLGTSNVTMQGDYVQSSTGTLGVTLTKPGAYPLSGHLGIEGDMALGGVLDLTLQRYSPTLGDTLELISANTGYTISGRFDQFPDQQISSSLWWNVAYGANAVTITAVDWDTTTVPEPTVVTMLASLAAAGACFRFIPRRRGN